MRLWNILQFHWKFHFSLLFRNKEDIENESSKVKKPKGKKEKQASESDEETEAPVTKVQSAFALLQVEDSGDDEPVRLLDLI